jgi:hypothetical protein
MNFQVISIKALFMLLLTLEPGLANTAVPGTVQSSNRRSDRTSPLIAQIFFKPPPGEPRTDRGAGSRDNRQCPQDATTDATADATTTQAAGKPTFTALVPSNDDNLTWSARPTFWVYVPKTSARQVVLSIKQGNQFHSQRFLPITGESGIIGIRAADATPLDVGKSYQWAIVLVCGDRPNPNDPVVTGWVRREQPMESLSSQSLSSQTALQQAARYSERGVWYDALTTLAEAKRSQPNNPEFAKTWTDFLSQSAVGLGAIATEPLRGVHP